METRGQRIKRIRKARGLSQRQVADRVGVDPMSVSRWERDETTPRDETREALAGILGVSVAVMEGYVEASPEQVVMQGLARLLGSSWEALHGAKSASAAKWADRRQLDLPVKIERRTRVTA